MSPADKTWETIWRWFLVIAVLATGLLFLCGCGQTREAQTTTTSTARTETVRVHQAVAPSGEIVQLTDKTVTIVNAKTGEVSSERIEIEPPKVVGQAVATAARALGTALGGPTAGAVAEQGVNWIWQTVAGVGALAGGTATGAVAVQRRRRRLAERERDDAARQRDELIDGVESAKEHMDDGTWKKVSKTLYDNQSDDTIATVRQRTA